MSVPLQDLAEDAPREEDEDVACGREQGRGAQLLRGARAVSLRVCGPAVNKKRRAAAPKPLPATSRRLVAQSRAPPQCWLKLWQRSCSGQTDCTVMLRLFVCRLCMSASFGLWVSGGGAAALTSPPGRAKRARYVGAAAAGGSGRGSPAARQGSHAYNVRGSRHAHEGESAKATRLSTPAS